MLHCVYHLSGEMEVVEDEDKERMIASGLWYDHPDKVKEIIEKERNKQKVESKNGKHTRIK